MMYVTIIKLLLDLANRLTLVIHNKQLIDAGRYQAIAEATQEALKNVQKAELAIARANSNDELAQRLRDKYGIKDDSETSGE